MPYSCWMTTTSRSLKSSAANSRPAASPGFKSPTTRTLRVFTGGPAGTRSSTRTTSHSSSLPREIAVARAAVNVARPQRVGGYVLRNPKRVTGAVSVRHGRHPKADLRRDVCRMAPPAEPGFPKVRSTPTPTDMRCFARDRAVVANARLHPGRRGAGSSWTRYGWVTSDCVEVASRMGRRGTELTSRGSRAVKVLGLTHACLRYRRGVPCRGRRRVSFCGCPVDRPGPATRDRRDRYRRPSKGGLARISGGQVHGPRVRAVGPCHGTGHGRGLGRQDG